MESATSSNLVEFTFQNLYRCVTGQHSIDPDILRTSLRLRIPKLRDCVDPFPKPSVTSSSAIRTGSVKLHDGLTVKVEEYQQDLVWKISERFNLDEIEAFVLLRSFLYNEQYQYKVSSSNGEGTSAAADLEIALLDSITEFYFDERLFILRIFAPLFRAQADEEHPLHDLASEILHEAAPGPTSLVSKLVSQYERRTKQVIPLKLPHANSTLGARSKWAKQIVREQICMLEVIFWATYNLRCPGSLVAEFYEAAYSTSLGSIQSNSNLLLDHESAQLLSDLESMIVITAVQVLSVELLFERGIDLEVVSLPRHGYFAQPAELERIHKLVYSTPTQPRFSPIVLAWACVIRRIASASEEGNYPQEYVPLLAELAPKQGGRDSVWQEFTRVALNPAMGLFDTLRGLLSSPLLNTEVAARNGSSLSNPNDNVVRAILKGLVIGLTELIRVEYIEDFDALVEVWIMLFGTGEWEAVAPLCAEFWQVDALHPSSNRRALLEIARDRFPVQGRPLVRVLRSLSASGEFKGLEGYVTEREVDYNRGGSAYSVFQYFDSLNTFTQVIPVDKPELKSLFEIRSTAGGIIYSNARPLRLPGGSIVPARSVGNVISESDAGSPVVVLWQHQHSGWKLALGLLKDFVRRRQISAGSSRAPYLSSDSVLQASSSSAQPVNLTFEDIGIEEGLDDPELITDILELFRSVLRNNHLLTPNLMRATLPEDEVDLSGWERASLIEVIPLLLQEALQISLPGTGAAPTRMITNILGVMTALLPHHPGSLWSSLRASNLLFGDVRHKGSTHVFLTLERAVGSYPMTLALLDLVRALFDESQRKMYTIPPSFRQIKTEVLLRGLAFLHNEIWLDFNSWKYNNLGEKYQIGTKISALFAEILEQAPAIPLENDLPLNSDDPQSSLITVARFVMDAFFMRSTPSTTNPLILTIAAGQRTREALHRARRFDDAHYLDILIESSLRLCRLVLVRKAGTNALRACLLEQGLFVGVPGASSIDLKRPTLNPVDTIARHYVRPPHELNVQLEAVKLLSTVCLSVSTCQPSPPSIVGYLSNPEEVVEYLLSVVQHADDEPLMRLAVWGFIGVAIDTQPGLASYLLSGRISLPPHSHPAKTSIDESRSPHTSAIDAAEETVLRWRSLWDQNPALLATALACLDQVWQHAQEYSSVIESLRKVENLWKSLSELVFEEIDRAPVCDVVDMIVVDGQTRSALHEAVSSHAYQTVAKAHVLHILSHDLTFSEKPLEKATFSSLSIVTKLFESSEALEKLAAEGVVSPANPEIHLQVRDSLESSFTSFTLESVRAVALPSDRVFGDDYLFPSALVEDRLRQYANSDPELERSAISIHKKILSFNLDWSLTDSHIALIRSWTALFRSSSAALRDRQAAQKCMLIAAHKIAMDVSLESRPGPIIVAVHAERLQLLLALLEATWIYKATADEILALLAPIQAIVTHEIHRPLESVAALISPKFHQNLLHLLYYCVHKIRLIRPSSFAASKRSSISSFVSAVLNFVIEALRLVFDRSHELDDGFVDQDMLLLVAVFEECTRADIGTSQTLWLSQLQSMGLIRSSFEILTRADITGTIHPNVVRNNGSPFYTPHILRFHLALAALPAAAERLAHEGAMMSYTSNTLTPSLEVGVVDVTHVAHSSWCTIVAIVTSLILVLGTSGQHFVDAEVVGFVQLYGAQLSKVLSWKVGEPMSISLLQEMEAVVLLFHAIATASMTKLDGDNTSKDILRAYGEKALFLVQQLNAALSYPNQLASSLEPLTNEERPMFEKEADLDRVSSTIEFLDKNIRPVLSMVVQKLVMCSSTILATLAIIGGSDMVLSRSDSPIFADMVLISTSSKVTHDEPATIGTLVELGNWTVQVLVHLLKSSQAPTPSLSDSLVLRTPFDRQIMMDAARHLLEGIMVLSATQLSRWLERERQTESHVLTNVNGREDSEGPQTRGKRGRLSVPMMTSNIQSAVQDQARDLNLLATRAKEVLGKFADKDGGSGLILLEVLIGFTSAKLLNVSAGGR